jgi:hypothetical protein
MRQGFDQHCPDCVYGIYVNTVYGKGCCTKFRTMTSRKRFPPQPQASEIPNTCQYFRDKNF